MLEVYYIKNKNSIAALHEYQSRYPDRRAPARSYFPRLDKILRYFGRVDVMPRGIPGGELEAMILEEICRKPESSSREVAAATGCDHSIVLVVLHKHGFQPFKIAKVQTLEQGDFQRRLAFCDWFNGQQTLDPQFYSRIPWSDESNFTIEDSSTGRTPISGQLSGRLQVVRVNLRGDLVSMSGVVFLGRKSSGLGFIRGPSPVNGIGTSSKTS